MTLFDSSGVPPDGDLATADGLRRLLGLPGVGPKSALRLAMTFGDWGRLRDASPQDLFGLVRTSPTRLKEAIEYSTPVPDLPVDVRAIGYFDEDWPGWLRPLSDSPVVLYVMGTVPVGSIIAIVGTRSPTRFGEKVVEAVSDEASRRSVGIVSGLALGIDEMAHRAALERNLLTWAVLGSGVDAPSPRENLELAERIVDAGGGLLSEQPPGTPASARTLVPRNRLQVAAADAVVVAQCGLPSGTLHTARFCLEQGKRLVAARPRPPWNHEKESRGSMALTDPGGFPRDAGETGGLPWKLISARRPVADVVLHDTSEVNLIWS